MSDCADKCTFPSCRCEWSKREEHCPRFGGTTKGYDPPPEKPEPSPPSYADEHGDFEGNFS